MHIDDLKKMGRAERLAYAEKEFGLKFWKYTTGEKMVAQIMLQEQAREKKKTMK